MIVACDFYSTHCSCRGKIVYNFHDIKLPLATIVVKHVSKAHNILSVIHDNLKRVVGLIWTKWFKSYTCRQFIAYTNVLLCKLTFTVLISFIKLCFNISNRDMSTYSWGIKQESRYKDNSSSLTGNQVLFPLEWRQSTSSLLTLSHTRITPALICRKSMVLRKNTVAYM